MILSTPVSQSHKSHAANGPPCPAPHAFSKTAYPSQPTPPEYMIDMLWTRSHWGPLEEFHPGHRLLMLYFLLYNRPRCQAGILSLTTSFIVVLNLIMFIITVTFCLTVRDAGFFKAMGLGPQGPNINMHCSSSSRHLCTLSTCAALQRVWSTFTFREVRKVHLMAPAAVHAALFSKEEFTACNVFQCYLVNCPLPPSLPPESTLRGSYKVATGFLHLLEPQTPLPAGYSANCTNCIILPTCDVNCLAVHKDHWTQGAS